VQQEVLTDEQVEFITESIDGTPMGTIKFLILTAKGHSSRQRA
jgi:hypothetical protein